MLALWPDGSKYRDIALQMMNVWRRLKYRFITPSDELKSIIPTLELVPPSLAERAIDTLQHLTIFTEPKSITSYHGYWYLQHIELATKDLRFLPQLQYCLDLMMLIESCWPIDDLEDQYSVIWADGSRIRFNTTLMCWQLKG